MICWSFATSSFLESEMARLKMEPVRLSVLYPMYCAFLEKARRYAITRGGSRFAAGDLFHGILDTYERYGLMPASAYGDKPNQQALDHTKLYAELEQLMAKIKEKENWKESRVLDDTREILNKHLGEPPKTFSYNGKIHTSKSFLDNVVRLPWKDYILITSFEYAPFDTFIELKVPDNWQHRSNYFNVPLNVFYDSLRTAVQSGFTVAVDADYTEPSYQQTKRYGIIPDFDIPWRNISQEAREFRFANGSTTDDHLMQIVGYRNFSGQDWFLLKDSWRVAWQNNNKGYVFFHESYIKLKVLAFLVHRDAVPMIKTLAANGK